MISAFMFTACQEKDIIPSGKKSEVTHPILFKYYQIRVADGIEYDLSNKGKEEVVIEADDNIQDYISVSQMGEVLYINKKKNSGVIWDSTVVKAHISTGYDLSLIDGVGKSIGTSNITLGGNTTFKIQLSGGSKFNAPINIPGYEAQAELADGSELTLRGTIKSLRLSSEGGSILNAYNLTATHLIAQIFSGGSKAYATVTGSLLMVDGKEGSKFYYKGNATPQILSLKDSSEVIHVE